MNTMPAQKPEHEIIESDTPTMRLFSRLEVIAKKDQTFSRQGLAEETGLPKLTLH